MGSSAQATKMQPAHDTFGRSVRHANAGPSPMGREVTGPRALVSRKRELFVGAYRRQRDVLGIGGPGSGFGGGGT